MTAGTRSQSTACSRQATWLRSRARSRCRLDHTFSTAGWSSAATWRQVLDRSAATATDSASSGSFLFVSPACSSRTRDASFGWTSRTRSPAATSCWASRRPSPAAPSTAQVRSGHAAAHSTSFPACAADARTRISPSGSSAALITTAVCDPLCGSTPIITAVISTLQVVVREWRTWRACLITDLLALAPLSSHATARPDRLAPRSKARPGQYRARSAGG